MNSLLPTTPEAASRGAELVTSDGRSLALVSAQLIGHAQGGLARLVLEQRFENDHAEMLKVTYRMPLPADGAISGYEFVIGERVVKGVIDKKRQARERFERALVEGRTAALLEQERADIFTQQIGNIPPHTAVVARITIDQRLVWLPEGEWELRFPTVIGPRYIGSADTAADVRATHVKVTDRPLSRTIQIELAIRDAIRAGAAPSSPSHTLTRRADGMIELHAGSRLDRDIVVRWPVAAAAPGLSLAAARRDGDADAYALLTIVPPAREAHPVAVPRDLIVLLDTSGSMSGGPLDKAKQVVGLLIDSLDEDDRLELIEFSDRPRRYQGEPVRATSTAKQAAIQWVRSRVASGGTEMRAGVIEALTTLRVGAQRQVVVVTDGYVGGEHQILEALNRRLPKSCRLHVLGVGSAVNRSLATSLARAGRGTEVLVGIDEDAERGAKRLLDRTKSPMVTNVEISGSALLRHAPAQVPDVFAGSPLVCALAIRPEGGELFVRGQLARDTWEQHIKVAPLAPGEGNGAIVQLYGRERVADVEANAMFGSVDGEIEDLGLTFQIATRMTSWVAIDEVRRELGDTPGHEQVIPQELPYGTTASAFGLRAAAPAMSTLAGAAPGDALSRFMMPAAAPPPPAKSRVSAVRTMAGVMRRSEADFDEEEPTGDAAASEEYESEGTWTQAPAEPLPPAQPRPPAAPRKVGAPAGRAAPPSPPASLPPMKSETSTLAGPDDLDLDAAEQKAAAPTEAALAESVEKTTARAGVEAETSRFAGGAAPQSVRAKDAAKASARTQAALAKPAATLPTPDRRKTALRWLVLAAILAIIALLMWWLAR